jgi:hypothetical protein
VIEYVDVNGLCVGVEICSSEIATWIYKESEWGEETDVTFSRSPSVFLNGCLHIIGDYRGYSKILAMDMEGNTWRKIDRPSGLQHSMHQAQVTCVYVLLVVPMILSFQFGSLKTMVLIIGH